MKNLFISHTEETPEVDFNINGQLRIKGVSIPENTIKFYKPVIEWIESCSADKIPDLKIEFEIEYANTSSSRVFVDIIKKIDALKRAGISTSIIWRYVEGDDDNYDLGKDMEFVTRTTIIFSAI